MGQDVCLLRSASQNTRFLNYLLHSNFMSWQLASLQIGSTFSRINVADVRRLLVLVPPRDEQDGIVEGLDRATSLYREPLVRTLGEIHLLREYKDRLVTDVVTGELDVRGASVGVVEESEGVDEPWLDQADTLEDAFDEASAEEVG
jgi:type I restriction enzyme, S subunit